MKELIGVGSNQAGQIYISDSDRRRWTKSCFEPGNDLPLYPYSSITVPIVAMRAQSSLRILYTDWATLLVERDGQLVIRGYPPHIYRVEDVKEQLKQPDGQCELPLELPHPYTPSDIKKGLGNRYALAGVLMSDGKLFHFRPRRWAFEPIDDEKFTGVVDITYSLSGMLNVLRDNGHQIDTYDKVESMSSSEPHIASIDSLLGPEAPQPSFVHRLPPHHADYNQFSRVLGCATTFVALTTSGKLFTSGDPRHDSLGRSVIPGQYPWGLITALDGIPIAKVATNPGSWLQIGLTPTGDVYIWGGKGDENIKGLPSRGGDHEEDVGLVDLGNEDSNDGSSSSNNNNNNHNNNNNGSSFREAEDVAVGCKHAMIVQKGGRKLWVAGKTDFGETGFGTEPSPTGLRGVSGDSEKDKTSLWRPWTEEMLCGPGRIVQVTSGVFNTLIVIDRDDVADAGSAQQSVAGSGPRSSRRRRREDSMDGSSHAGAATTMTTIPTSNPWESANGNVDGETR